MDFQSAARFGERRVMVTDYDETAVEVNAKVVDEDTGEVICESGGGGGGGDLVNAVVSVTSDSTASLSLHNRLVNAATLDPSLSGYMIEQDTVQITAGNSENILVPYNGLYYAVSDVTIAVIDGDATITEMSRAEGTFYALKISGNCTVKLTGPK